MYKRDMEKLKKEREAAATGKKMVNLESIVR